MSRPGRALREVLEISLRRRRRAFVFMFGAEKLRTADGDTVSTWTWKPGHRQVPRAATETQPRLEGETQGRLHCRRRVLRR